MTAQVCRGIRTLLCESLIKGNSAHFSLCLTKTRTHILSALLRINMTGFLTVFLSITGAAVVSLFLDRLI